MHGLRTRRLLAAFVLLLPGLCATAADWFRRGRLLSSFAGGERFAYLATVLGSFALWALLLYVAAGRRGPMRHAGAVVFVVLFAFSFAVQQAFFGLYSVYINIDPLVFGDDFPRAILGVLPVDLVLPRLAFGIGLALALVWAARRTLRPRRRLRQLAPLLAAAAVVAAFAAPVSPPVPRQAAAPEVMYFHALAVLGNDRLIRLRPGVRPQIVRLQRRRPEPVPAFEARPPSKRNVLLLLQEAQRADVTCIGYESDCRLATRATNRLTPTRLPFFQVRAATSSTAVAVAVLWSGIDPTETYERMYSAPLIWEYARAAGYDTAYWTSQNLMFGNARLMVQDVPLTARAVGTNIDPQADILTGADDDKLVERALADLPKLAEPFFAVVHFSNIHRPRVVDQARAPFQPTNLSDTGPGGIHRRNHYKNSVYLSDLAAAHFIEQLRATDVGKRTVLFYTSDHGEAYGEHKNENDHSSTVYEEEIRIPQWIDAPDGVLSADEIAGYQRNGDALISQYDQAATLLDLLGIWDAPGFAEFRPRMLGTPAARPIKWRPLPLTNVSWVWEYHRPNWGMMYGPVKLVAQLEDPAYKCFNVLMDPGEKVDLGADKCVDLVADADRTFGMLPKDMRRLRDRPDWGRAGGRAPPTP
ncbi:MAG: sulfatase-like hydrolase/transferase [Myxococcales bacterium]|nr:sulfatase-like hydrolase/transferase [Myxococcales bacterium]